MSTKMAAVLAALSLGLLGCQSAPDSAESDSEIMPPSSKERPMPPPGSSSVADESVSAGDASNSETLAVSDELSKLKKLAGLFGRGFSTVRDATGEPHITGGGTNTYGYQTYWAWIPEASDSDLKQLKIHALGTSYNQLRWVFVVAGFSDKKELFEAGVTWPLFESGDTVRTRTGSMAPCVRTNFPKLKDGIRVLELPTSFELAILERELAGSAEAAQKPTSLWKLQNGVYFAPDRVLVVFEQGALEYHLRCYVNGESIISRRESLNEQTGQLVSTETASAGRDFLLESPLCSAIIVKKGARTGFPIQLPVRIDQTPPNKIPYERFGSKTGRAIRLRLNGS